MKPKSRLAAAALGTALLPGTASAAPAHAFSDGPSGCNHSVCLYTAYTGSGYKAWAEFRINITKGHHHITGPRLDVNTPDGPWRAGQDSRAYHGRGNGNVCAEGWSYSAGRWHSIGLPCVTIG